MRIWAISDTHGFHDQLIIPDNIDGVIHAGDFTNERNVKYNTEEYLKFKYWWDGLKAPFKVIIAGNHDTAIADGKVELPEGYLCNSGIVKNGISIFGSPYTPSFGVGWAFNVARNKSAQVWELIPYDMDIVVTHGPPFGILDLTERYGGALEMCGDKSLLNRIKQVKPKYHIFGHIHDCGSCINHGMLTRNGTTFINASVVTDRKFNQGPSSNGVIIDL